MGNARNIAFWVVLFLLILALFNLFSGGQSTMSSRTISYSDFVAAVDNGEVASVTLDGERVLLRGNDGQDYTTVRPEGTDITERLIEQDITVNARPQEQSGFTTVLMTFLPFILSGAITSLTALYFLGLGLRAGSPSLGELLNQGKTNLTAPWLGLSSFTVLALMLSLLVFIGEAASIVATFEENVPPGTRVR